MKLNRENYSVHAILLVLALLLVTARLYLPYSAWSQGNCYYPNFEAYAQAFDNAAANLNSALQTQKTAEQNLEDCLGQNCVVEAATAIAGTVTAIYEYPKYCAVAASWWGGSITTTAFATHPHVVVFGTATVAAISGAWTFYNCATDDCSSEKVALQNATQILEIRSSQYQNARQALENCCS